MPPRNPPIFQPQADAGRGLRRYTSFQNIGADLVSRVADG